MTVWKATYHAETADWLAVSRKVFVETATADVLEARAVALGAAMLEYPGAAITIFSLRQTTVEERNLFLAQRREIRRCLARAAGRENRGAPVASAAASARGVEREGAERRERRPRGILVALEERLRLASAYVLALFEGQPFPEVTQVGETSYQTVQEAAGDVRPPASRPAGPPLERVPTVAPAGPAALVDRPSVVDAFVRDCGCSAFKVAAGLCSLATPEVVEEARRCVGWSPDAAEPPADRLPEPGRGPRRSVSALESTSKTGEAAGANRWRPSWRATEPADPGGGDPRLSLGFSRGGRAAMVPRFQRSGRMVERSKAQVVRDILTRHGIADADGMEVRLAGLADPLDAAAALLEAGLTAKTAGLVLAQIAEVIRPVAPIDAGARPTWALGAGGRREVVGRPLLRLVGEAYGEVGVLTDREGTEALLEALGRKTEIDVALQSLEARAARMLDRVTVNERAVVVPFVGEVGEGDVLVCATCEASVAGADAVLVNREDVGLPFRSSAHLRPILGADFPGTDAYAVGAVLCGPLRLPRLADASALEPATAPPGPPETQPAATAEASPSTPADVFHDHLDACERCRNNPFDLCDVGVALIKGAIRGETVEQSLEEVMAGLRRKAVAKRLEEVGVPVPLDGEGVALILEAPTAENVREVASLLGVRPSAVEGLTTAIMADLAVIQTWADEASAASATSTEGSGDGTSGKTEGEGADAPAESVVDEIQF